MANLNAKAYSRCQKLIGDSKAANIAVSSSGGATLVDCGVHSGGGLRAGRALAEICLAGLAEVQLTISPPQLWSGPLLTVATDHPIAACLASQYAGWRISGDDFFAMGSGPMRAAYGGEQLFDAIGHRESPQRVVGVLESSRLPEAETCAELAEKCAVAPEALTLLVARTASIAGSLQVVARSIETALHKLHELEFDLNLVRAGFGSAPLPPVAADDLTGIGRTNDAILYGGEVVLWVDGDDETLIELGPQTPSCASAEHGEPFGEIFRRHNHDFYKVDPLLFSPAVVSFWNVHTGRTFRFGETRPDVLQRSFAG